MIESEHEICPIHTRFCCIKLNIDTVRLSRVQCFFVDIYVLVIVYFSFSFRQMTKIV